MAVTLTIGVTLRPIAVGSLDLVEGINGRASLRVGIVSTTGAYIPTVEEIVTLYEGVTVIFKGIISNTTVRYLALGAGLITTIEAADYSAYAERRVLNASTAGGITGRDAIDYIVDNYLAGYGVTRDPAMPTGATLGALAYDYAKVSDVLTDIVRLAAPTGWLWRIDDGKVLRAFLPGAVAYACPFNVVTGATNLVGDVEVRTIRDAYANKVYFVYGDGTTTPAMVSATNASEVTARGLYEMAIQSQGPYDVATAQSICDGYLAQMSFAPKEITFTTRQEGAHAGQTLTINLAARGVSSSPYLIHEVRMFDQGGVAMYRIKAIEGATPKLGAWKETYKLWAGLGPQRSGGAGWASVAPPVRFVYRNFSADASPFYPDIPNDWWNPIWPLHVAETPDDDPLLLHAENVDIVANRLSFLNADPVISGAVWGAVNGASNYAIGTLFDTYNNNFPRTIYLEATTYLTPSIYAADDVPWAPVFQIYGGNRSIYSTSMELAVAYNPPSDFEVYFGHVDGTGGWEDYAAAPIHNLSTALIGTTVKWRLELTPATMERPSDPAWWLPNADGVIRLYVNDVLVFERTNSYFLPSFGTTDQYTQYLVGAVSVGFSGFVGEYDYLDFGYLGGS